MIKINFQDPGKSDLTKMVPLPPRSKSRKRRDEPHQHLAAGESVSGTGQMDHPIPLSSKDQRKRFKQPMLQQD